jgi:hypothetical protein
MKRYVFVGLLLVGIAFRVLLLAKYEMVNGGEVDVYLADEGVVGLMGKHILEGHALPVFFYGQDYLGALEAYCAAASFALFGIGFTSLRLVPFLFSLGVLAAVYRFASLALSVPGARWATALTAVAPLYFLQWNLKARGGFVEHIVLVLLMLIFFWRFHFHGQRDARTALLLGFTAGIALWVNQLALAYVGTLAGLVVLSANRRGVGVAVAGLLLGSSMLLAYNVAHPLATVRALGRKAVVLNRVPVEERDERWVARGAEKRVGALRDGAAKLGLVFGVPPGASVERLGLSDQVREGGKWTGVRRTLGFVPVLAFGVALLAAFPHRVPRAWSAFGPDQLILLLLVVTFVVGYVSPRYMLPAYPLAAIAYGSWAARLQGGRRAWAAIGAAALIAFNVLSWSDTSAASAGDAGEETGVRLLSFLEQQGLTRCYSAAPLYHLVFRSEEHVLLVPLQKDRIPAYDRDVEASDSICYVFRKDQEDKRQHIAMMRVLEQEHVHYSSAEVGHYRVLWGFSPRAALSRPVIDSIRTPRDPSVSLGRDHRLEDLWS